MRELPEHGGREHEARNRMTSGTRELREMRPGVAINGHEGRPRGGSRGAVSDARAGGGTSRDAATWAGDGPMRGQHAGMRCAGDPGVQGGVQVPFAPSL